MSSSNNKNKRKVVGFGCTSTRHIENCGCSWECIICKDTNPAMNLYCNCREITKAQNAEIIAASIQSSRSGAGNMIPTTPSTIATTPNNSNTKRRKKKSKNNNNAPANNNTPNTNHPQLKHRPSKNLTSTPAVGGRSDIDDDDGPRRTRSKTWQCSICKTVNSTSSINCRGPAGFSCRGNSLVNWYSPPRNNVSNGGMSTSTATAGYDRDEDEDYVDDEGSVDDEDYDPSCLNVRSGDSSVYTKKSHTNSINSGTYLSKQQDGELPSDIQQRNCIPMPSRCTLSKEQILNQRMEGMSLKSPGETPANPCDTLDNVAKLKSFTEVGYEPLKGATLCRHFDDHGVRCTRVATTLLEPVNDTRVGASRTGHENQYCDLHGSQYATQMNVTLVWRPCACKHGYERYADGSPLCKFGYMQIECYKEGCTDTRHQPTHTLCKRHALEQECAKEGCKETRARPTNVFCLKHSNAEPCASCNRPRNTGVYGIRLCNECNKCKGCYGPRSHSPYALCNACAILEKCVKCKANPVVRFGQNKCRACHPDHKACKKCGLFNVVGKGCYYCSDKCRSLCKAKGCTATAKPNKKDKVTGEVLTWYTYCGRTKCNNGYRKSD